MPFPHRHNLTSFIILLLIFLPSRVSALPGFRTPQDDHQLQKFRNIFPRLAWLRDAAIEGTFGVSPHGLQSGIGKQHKGLSRNSQLPRTLLARYGGDVVLRFNLTTSFEEQAFAEAVDTLFLDVWEFTSNWADIRLREDDIPSLLGLLPSSLHAAYSPVMPDLAMAIYQSYPSTTFAEAFFPLNHHMSVLTPVVRTHSSHTDSIFQDYQPMSVIIPWMRLMASMFSTHVRLINLGTTFEGRDIPALRVGVSPEISSEHHKPRKTIIISGGSHAREWISISTALYIAWSLMSSYCKDPRVTNILEKFDFVFIPTLNVDGYIYTWENDRLWRKSRQATHLRFCQGLDLDRSFGYEWDGTTYGNNPCSESYPGDKPFQAVESQKLAEWAKNEAERNNVKFVGFLDFHAYSQQILYPYSYSCATKPPGLENLEELGMGIAKAIRASSGQVYNVASACEGAVPFFPGAKSSRVETGGGSAIDWFHHEMNVRYSYQVKLRDTGSYGFLLPRENIVPTGEEALDVVMYLGEFLLGNKGIEKGLDEDGNVHIARAEYEIRQSEDLEAEGTYERIVNEACITG